MNEGRPQGRLNGRVAVVTGAGSGIGRATALRLYEEGARLVCVDIHGHAAESTAGLVEGLARTCDVRDAAAIEALIADVVTTRGQLDILVNNVGLTLGGALGDLDDAQWRALVSVNLDSVFFGLRAALRHMRPRGSGTIVNVSSGAGLLGSPGMGAYGACKAGVIHLTQTAALENLDRNIRVNCLVPGSIATPAMLDWAEHGPGGRVGYEQGLIPGRFGTPEEMAACIAFLVSDDASFVNGAALVADGGASALLAPLRGS